jgi:5-methylcytosine-specific restriction endonuclease McrA
LGKATEKRRAAERGVEWIDFDPLEVYERDDWICQLCDYPIDPDERWPSRWSVTIDHKLPIGIGPHSPSNAQAAHKGCNSSKQKRLEWTDRDRARRRALYERDHNPPSLTQLVFDEPDEHNGYDGFEEPA